MNNEQKDNNEFLKQFGIFTGFYNKVNNTNLTVKQALTSNDMRDLFQSFAEATAKIKINKNESTKYRSYSLLNIPEVDKEVLQYVKSNNNKSRADIAAATGLRLSTVCGAISRLVNNKMLEVSGTKRDPKSNRNVETLKIV